MVPPPDHPNGDCVLDVAPKTRQVVAQLDKGDVSMSRETDHNVPSQQHLSEK